MGVNNFSLTLCSCGNTASPTWRLLSCCSAWVYDRDNSESRWPWLDNVSGVDNLLKAVEGGQIVGSVRALLLDGMCQIGRLMVTPAQQGRGIGTALIRHVEDLFPAAQRFEPFTGSRSEQNIRLYQKLGYALYKTQNLSEQVTLVYLEKYRRNS